MIPVPIEKSQNIRLLDVFIIGPLMIYAAKTNKPIVKYSMIGLGIATILYNLNNYLRQEKAI